MEWNRVGIPHKGWICIGVEDVAESVDYDEDIEYEQCEMCGNEKIRYVHIMQHPDFPEELHVGCVCAEKMSGDYVNPRRDEKRLRKRAARRTNFNKREWNCNPAKRTYSKKYKGEYITMMENRYGNWGIFFANKRFWEYKGRRMNSFEEAERVAFDIFEEFHTTQEEREYRY